MTRTRALPGLVVLAILFFNPIPWRHKKVHAVRDPVTLYNEGLAYMSDREGRLSFLHPPDYEKARKDFDEILFDHPTSRFAPLAELRVADCYYESGEYESAAPAYDNWRKNHVGRPEIPYVTYRVAMSYYHQILSIDRDQTTTRIALLEFQNLVKNYPDSEYAGAVGDKAEILRTRLAKHEFYVGQFYFRHHDYWAAIDRFQVILDNFPKKGLDEKALYWSWRSYKALGRRDQAEHAYNLLNERFPDGDLTRRAKLTRTEKSAKGAQKWLGQ